jgi:transposase
MQHKQEENRAQMFMFSLESAIAPDSFVRVVDAFVNVIDLKSFGFAHVECKEEGRPPYPPAALLKLYLYGYRYGIRTTRKLEREAQTNVEAMWLLSGLKPKYKTISDFRKNHSKAFREVFRRFVCLLKEWNLIEGQTLAIDSFKIRANNSLKNNFNESKLKRHLEYIEIQIKQYESQLDTNDKEEDRQELENKIAERREQQSNYQQIKTQLKESGKEQISLSDPDARAVILHRNIVNVGYNVQSSSDAKNKLLVEYDTGEVNDTHALSRIAIASKQLLEKEKLEVLADKGYHTGEEIQKCEAENITTYVSPRASSSGNTELYTIDKFTYDKETDSYSCPAGEQLQTNGNWLKHSKSKDGRSPYRFKRYISKACKTCQLLSKCTSCNRGRQIDRSEYAESLESNNRRVLENPEYYRERQQITEHQFGTLKRQRGFTHTLVRGKDNVLGEVGLMFIGYNLSRCVSILGIEILIKYLKDRCLRYKNHLNGVILSILSPQKNYSIKIAC